MTLAALSLRSRADDSTRIDVRTIDGPDGDRRVIWVELGAGQASAPMSSQASANVAHAATVARAEGIPLVCVLSSTGADVVEGIASLEGWGRVAKAFVDCSGVVPTILVVDGPVVAAPALLLGIADLVVMTAESYAFVNGPVMVADFTGVQISTDELGGAAPLERQAGVASLVVADRPRPSLSTSSATSRRAPTRNPAGGRAPIRSTGAALSSTGCSRPRRPAATTSAPSPA